MNPGQVRVDALNEALNRPVGLPSSLTGGGDSTEHYHSSDRVPTHDTLSRLQQLARQNILGSGTYYVTDKDDVLLSGSGGVIILPAARNGREFEVIMTGDTPVEVRLTGTDLIYGESSVMLTVKSTALRFKAIAGGWVFI